MKARVGMKERLRSDQGWDGEIKRVGRNIKAM